MKKVWLTVLFCLQPLLCAVASAAPCVSASLAAYLGLPPGGCTIGTLQFSDFLLLQEPTNAVPFSAVTVSPVVVGANQVGFDFTVNASVGANTLLEDLLGYRVTGIGSAIVGNSIALTGATATGDGAVTNTENLCLGGIFAGADGLSNCTGIANVLIVFAVDGLSDTLESLSFGPVPFLRVVTDFAVDGGTAGTAALASTNNRFITRAVASVPAPSTISLLALTGALLLLVHRSRSGRSRSA